MAFDSLVANPGRLKIMTALAGEAAQTFVEVRARTGLTDGNLATHARRLQSAGFVQIEKFIIEGKPLTRFHLTDQGREALVAHARSLISALRPSAEPAPVAPSPLEPSPPEPAIAGAQNDDDWVD